MGHRRRSKRRLLEDKSSVTMLEQPAKRPKTITTTSAGVPVIDALPPELVDTIIGLLDVQTLCTARLVCTKFRGAASRCIHSVEISAETLRSQPEITLNNFPNLSRVSICNVKEDDLPMLAQSPVGAAVTHLRAVQYLRGLLRRTRTATGITLAPLLPNLMSLTLNNARNRASSFPQTLRELSLAGYLPSQTANVVARLADLTSLRFDIYYLDNSVTAVTALTALQRLEICCKPSVIPFLAELTQLTHLQFLREYHYRRAMPLEDLAPLASLSRLQRLAHLGVRPLGAWGAARVELETVILASIATITGLRSLDLELCGRPERSAFETVCMTPFTQLTALRLKSNGMDASFLPRFNMEALQDLSLSWGVQLDRDGVAALRKATGLTRLDIWAMETGAIMGPEELGPEELGITLSRMPRLRALSFNTRELSFNTCSLSFNTRATSQTTPCLKAIGLLTELTRLQWNELGLNGGSVEVCLGLHKLRVLRSLFAKLWSWRVAPDLSREAVTLELFFAVAKLPELSPFIVGSGCPVSGWDLEGFLDDIRARLNGNWHGKYYAPVSLKWSTQ